MKITIIYSLISVIHYAHSLCMRKLWNAFRMRFLHSYCPRVVARCRLDRSSDGIILNGTLTVGRRRHTNGRRCIIIIFIYIYIIICKEVKSKFRSQATAARGAKFRRLFSASPHTFASRLWGKLISFPLFFILNTR